MRPVALFAPELAAGIENICKRGIKPQRHIIVADSAVDLVLAIVHAAAHNQCPDAVGPHSLVIVDQHAASGDDLVIVTVRGSRNARRGVD